MNKNWAKQDLDYFRRCEAAYKLYIRKINTGSDERVIERYSQRSTRKDTEIAPKSMKVVDEKEKRPLNEYQCFLKEKSKKYREYSPKSRMSMIAHDWKTLSQSKK